MKRLLARWLPIASLFCWGILLLYFYFSGRLSSFLHPTFRPYVPIAGGILVLLGIVALCTGNDEEGHFYDACCGHGRSERMPFSRVLTFLVLLVPATVAALSSKDTFDSNAIRNRGVVTNAANLVRQNNQPAKAPVTPPKSTTIEVQVTELLYAAQDSTLRPALEGKSIEVIGQLMPETANNANGHRVKIVRMFMVCCAADARPIAVTVECNQAPNIPEMSWVKAVGQITFPIEGGQPLAVLKAEKIAPTDPPSEVMLY